MGLGRAVFLTLPVKGMGRRAVRGRELCLNSLAAGERSPQPKRHSRSLLRTPQPPLRSNATTPDAHTFSHSLTSVIIKLIFSFLIHKNPIHTYSTPPLLELDKKYSEPTRNSTCLASRLSIRQRKAFVRLRCARIPHSRRY